MNDLYQYGAAICTSIQSEDSVASLVHFIKISISIHGVDCSEVSFITHRGASTL